ncbi:MAG: serine/threonine-protein kinase [Aureliella sp.]
MPNSNRSVASTQPGKGKSLLEMQLASWNQGRPLSLETLFGFQDEPNTELMLDLLYQEVCRREDAGEHLRADEYSARFPALRQDIEALFEVHHAMKRDFDMESAEEGTCSAAAYSDRYAHERELGVGGLGRVFLALDKHLGRSIAVKKLLPQYSQSRHHRERFLREATLTAKLTHPSIVPIYDMGSDEHGELYYSMKFLDGQSLDDLTTARSSEFHWSEHRVELRRLVNYIVSVCRGVSHAHEKGILHRDIKPANILVGNQNEVLLVDWGIAGYVRDQVADQVHHVTLDESLQTKTTQNDANEAGYEAEPSNLSGRLTVAGMRLGTPAFMSPEQLDDPQSATTQSDVYSLGATLFFSLTGYAPKQAPQDDWGPTRELLAVCEKAMSPTPNERYGSAADLAEDLENWLAGEPMEAFPEGVVRQAVRWCVANKTLVLSATATCFVAFALLMVFVLQELRVQEARNEKLEQKSLADERLYRSAMIVLASSKELNSHAIFSDAPDSPDQEELRIAIRQHCRDMLSGGCEERQAELHLHIAMCSARLKDFRRASEHVTQALQRLSKLQHLSELEPLVLDAQLLVSELHLRAGRHVEILKLVKAVEQKHDLQLPEYWHYAQGFQLMRGFAFAALQQNFKAANALGSVANSELENSQAPSMLPPFTSPMKSSIQIPPAVFQAGMVCQARAQLASTIVWQRQPVMTDGLSMFGIFSFPAMPAVELERVFFESPSALAAEIWNVEQLASYGGEPPGNMPEQGL